MSKRALIKYLQSLEKSELESQVLDLYSRFKPVKTYYNFVFNPKEDKLVEEAKFKIGHEYFPTKGRKPKTRRSVAQKFIRHFMTLELDPALIADIMLFNLETTQRYNAQKVTGQEAFYKSLFNAFEQAVGFIEVNGLKAVYEKRLTDIVDTAFEQEWFNAEGMDRLLHPF